MRGKNKGTQARTLEINGCALNVSGGADKRTPKRTPEPWNLVISDAAKSSKYIADFFALINRIDITSSSSPSRWDTLHKHIPIYVEELWVTRWK